MLSDFRNAVGDQSRSRPAIILELKDDVGRRSDTVTVTVLDNVLALTPTIRSEGYLQKNLTDSDVSTLQLLVEFLNKQKYYSARLAKGAVPGHVSNDIGNIYNETLRALDGLTLHTHVYSDADLMKFIMRGMQRHNPTFETLDEIPPQERPFVLTLARCELLSDLSGDSIRRVTMEESVEQLMLLKADLEQQYKADYSRLKRAFRPVENLLDPQGEGEVMVTALSRKRVYGYMTPFHGNRKPYTPILNAARNVSDQAALITWFRPVETDLLDMELWRSTEPGVERKDDAASEIEATLSTQVWALSQLGNISALEEVCPTRFFDDGLEPNTRYYYKLYVIDTAGQLSESREITVKTLATGAKLDAASPISPATGTLGVATPVTLTGTGFTAGCRFLVGDKEVSALTIVNPTTATATVPAYMNANSAGYKAVVVIDPSGQFDKIDDAFQVS